MGVRDSSEIDKLFLKIALQDDEKAFQTLFFEFFPSLCVFAHRYVSDWDTCEDLVQDTFFKVWKNRKSIEIKISSRNFLITSVRNACLDFLRKQKGVKEEYHPNLLDTHASTNDNLYSHIELEQMFNAALSRLPENVREVFEMSRFEGKTYKEIAKDKNISIKTVESYMTRALKILRVELKDYLPLLIFLIDNSL
ncbi:MAG: RNA polymerase sigma-70 factor [Bacteroidales bacterium]